MTDATQLTLDLDEGRSRRDAGLALKERGLDSVEAHSKAWLEEARQVAEFLYHERGSVTVDWVLQYCPRPAYVHPNATGAIFRDPKRWRRLEPDVQSSQPNAHARRIGVWALKDGLERGAGTSKVTALKSAKGNPTGGGLACTRAPANSEENNR